MQDDETEGEEEGRGSMGKLLLLAFPFILLVAFLVLEGWILDR